MEIMSYASLAGSAFSTVCTGYFWLVRARRERPSLKPYLAAHEIFYGLQRPPDRHIGIKLGIIVANYSLLPNALLGVRLWLKRRDKQWHPVLHASFGNQTPLPFNIPSSQTVMLTMNGVLAFPIDDKLEDGGLPAYVERYLTDPREIKVELKGLQGLAHTDVVSYAAGEPKV